MPNAEPQGTVAEALRAIREASAREDGTLMRQLCDAAVREHPQSPELWAVYAHTLLWRDRRDDARAAVQKACELGGDACAMAVAMEASLAGFEGRTTDAVAAAERAASMGEMNQWVYQWCIDAYHISGDNAKALQFVERWHERYPDDPEALALRLICLQSAGRKAEADALLERSELSCPDEPRLHRARARRLSLDGKLTEAVKLLQRTVKIAPNSSSSWSGLASALSHSKRDKEAEQAAKRALELTPVSVEAMGAMARVCVHRGKQAEAVKWQQQADEAIPAMKWNGLLTKANAALRKGDWETTLALATQALGAPAAPTQQAALSCQARALVSLGRGAEALAALADLRQRGWDTPGWYELQGRATALGGDADGALATYREGIERYPGYGALRAHLLRLLHERGDVAAAEMLVQESLANPSDTPWGFTEIAMALSDTNHAEAFRQMVQMGQARFPGSEALKLFEAVDLLERGDLAAARKKAEGVGGELREVAGKLDRSAERMAETNAAMARGDWAKVAELAEETIREADPSLRMGGLKLKALALLQAERYDEAETTIAELEAAGLDTAEPYYLRGRIQFRRGETEAAISTFRKGLARYPTAASLRRPLLSLLHQRGDAEAEQELVQDTLAHLPGTAREMVSLFTALMDTEHEEAAAKVRAVAEERFPRAEASRFFEALDRLWKGDIKGARARLQGVVGDWRTTAERVDQEVASLEATLQTMQFWAKRKPGPEAPRIAAESPRESGDTKHTWRFWERKR